MGGLAIGQGGAAAAYEPPADATGQLERTADYPGPADCGAIDPAAGWVVGRPWMADGRVTNDGHGSLRGVSPHGWLNRAAAAPWTMGQPTGSSSCSRRLMWARRSARICSHGPCVN